MSVAEIMQELQSYGSEQTKKTYLRHGAKEPFFGVKISDMKNILKKTKKDYQLALDLYATGNGDAMYLAGLMADEKKMTKADLQKWVEGAYWYMLTDFTVAWVAAESAFGHELGLEWIESKNELIASAGWCTLASRAGIKADSELDLDLYSKLLERAAKEIKTAPNHLRGSLNGFIIAVGIGIASLTEKAEKLGEKIGVVYVDMGDTACKVPGINDYIQKAKTAGKIGKKKKMARC